jgi:hypothetical protein
MRLDYELEGDGSGKLHISGSRIPSQSHYVADSNELYSEDHFHDMESNNLNQIKGVVEAGPGRVAGNYYKRIDLRGW